MISLWGSVLRRKDLSARAVITLSRYRWPCIYIREIKNQNFVINEYLSHYKPKLNSHSSYSINAYFDQEGQLV